MPERPDTPPADAGRALAPLYVRLPRRAAELLDRAAFENRVSKRELVTSLVQRYLGEEEGDRRAAPARDREMLLGRHDFRPAEAPAVLTLPQAAALLQVAPAALEDLALAGEVPGRRIAGDWRFSRVALLDWLGAPADR